MEVLGAASSALAVIELSAKVAILCLAYLHAVKNAQNDILRLQNEVLSVEGVLKKTQQLHDQPGGAPLSASSEALASIHGCSQQLTALHEKLVLKKRSRALSRIGLRELRWPFESREVDEIIKQLERHKSSLTLAFQVDQTILIQELKTTVDLEKLPLADGAAFDSYSDQLDARCHPETRIDLLRQIEEWALNPHGKCLFWLSGMAGTGKSTIARTSAYNFAVAGQLGASFFFKRGEGDRGNATRLFTTIARQLAQHFPTIGAYIKKTVEEDPSISTKALREQFERLIRKPLSAASKSIGSSPLVVVIDALDECENENYVKLIVHLLGQIHCIEGCKVRVFLTSRPELPIRLGFKEISRELHQDMILHDMPVSVMEHDIAAFLRTELTRIRSEYNTSLSPDQDPIPAEWPDEKSLQALVKMAVPLFIFAATACRFIDERNWDWDPEGKLKKVMSYQAVATSTKMEQTYLPVLNQLLAGNLSKIEKENRIQEFQELLGPILVLAEPLPRAPLAELLGLSTKVVDRRLNSLYSVLDVSADPESPIRILHLSFRDFLLNHEGREQNSFLIDEHAMHKNMGYRCLDLLENTSYLKQDICGLGKPGSRRSEIETQTINRCLPRVIQYACRYWIHHFSCGGVRIRDNDKVHRFLQTRLLYWLEALSWIGRISESMVMMADLENLLVDLKQDSLWNLIQGAWRLVMEYKDILDTAPLQLYCSGIIFVPETNMVRKYNDYLVPRWICALPKLQNLRDRTIYTLEGHSDLVWALAVSSAGSQLASGSRDNAVRLWSTKLGTTLHTLEGHSGSVIAVAFSPNDESLASASCDKTIKIWDTTIGLLRQTWTGHTDKISGIEYSPDGDRLASCSYDKTIKLWDANTGTVLSTLSGHPESVTAIAYLANGALLASCCAAGLIKMWDTITGDLKHTMQCNIGLRSLVCSPDSKYLAALDLKVLVYLTNASILKYHLAIQSKQPTAITFSRDSKQLICGEMSSKITLWDTATGDLQQVLYGHTTSISAVGRSPTGMNIASGSYDGMIKLWNPFVNPRDPPPKEDREYSGYECRISLSPDGKQAASFSFENSDILLWDAMHDLGTLRRVLKAPSDLIKRIMFSMDGNYFVSGSSHGLLSLWDLAQGCEEPVLTFTFDPKSDLRETEEFLKANNHFFSDEYGIEKICFSPDASQVMVALRNGMLSLLHIKKETIERSWTFRDRRHLLAVAFSEDSRQIACEWSDYGDVTILNASNGKELQSLQAHDVFNLPVGGTRLRSHHGELYWEVSTETETGQLNKKAKIPFVDYKLWSNLALNWEDAEAVIVRGQWIVREHDGQMLLWLPPNYRATDTDYRDGTLALAHPFGRVTVLKFDLSRLETG